MSLLRCLFCVAGILLVGCWADDSKGDEPPNVVLFFIDDLGYTDLGCYGSEFYHTPNIDALARSGVRFTDFYSANPVCSPTRAALMTGKAPQRVGITQWISQPNEKHLPLDEFTIGEAFEKAGYQTGYIGKWHLGERDWQMPSAQGFSWMRSVNRAGQPASYFHPFAGRQRNGVGYWDVPDLEDTAEGDYLTDKMTDHALTFISENQERRFFLCFAHYAVHTPIEAPSDLIRRYEEKRATQFGSGIAELATERNNSLTRTRQDNSAYAAMVENLDTNVGRVLRHLDDCGLAKNTVVVFTSDNGGLSTTARGGPTSCRPLRAGKGWTYEGGIRVPAIVSWPQTLTPGVCAVPGITMDLYPTLLDLTGLPALPDQHMDGISLGPVLTNTSATAPGRVLAWHYPHNHGSGHTPSSAIRKGRWKLIHLSDSQQYELYDLQSDIAESNNLAAQDPQKVRELADQLDDWLSETISKNAVAK